LAIQFEARSQIIIERSGESGVMPIYEYACAACGHHLEVLQKMSEGPLRKCPDCGKSQLRRLVSASRFRLKGSGWYETDFKGDSEKKRNLVETAKAESEGSSAKSEDKQEAASAEATPAAPAAPETAKSAAVSTDKPKPKPPAAKRASSKKPTKPRAAKSARG
jgi:putative FmdB family regulatory protein